LAAFSIGGLPAGGDVLAGSCVGRGVCAGSEREVKRRTLVYDTVCPDRAAVAVHGADDVARPIPLPGNSLSR
jgi:hypothetical protein